MEKQKYTVILAVVGLLLIFSIFKWINYLLENNYIVECFQQNTNRVNSDKNKKLDKNKLDKNKLDKNKKLDNSNTNSIKSDKNINTNTTHTVDMPLTTTYSCRNFCAPATARCALTGHQCFTDIDCPGCQPQANNIIGDNSAGKLTVGMTPQYSNLTSGMGTKSMTFLDKEFSKTPTPTFGVNTWRDDFDAEQKLFNKRYKPPSTLPNMPSYPPRYSVTGDFLEDGPLASNATIL